MKKNLLTLSCWLLLSNIFAQTDSIPIVLEPVEVVALPLLSDTYFLDSFKIIGKQQLQLLPLSQVSDVLKVFSGLMIRDYGGIGGLKTVSIRGLGTQHTGIEYDGLSITDYQSGQIDIGRFSLSHLESVGFENNTMLIFKPARFFASAGVVYLTSRQPDFSKQQPWNFDIGLTGGSFGLWNPRIYLSFHTKPNVAKKNLIGFTIQATGLWSNGKYPFTQYYGSQNDSSSRETRQNGDVRNISAEGNFFLKHKQNRYELKAKVFYYNSERGMPGPIIYYQSAGDDRWWEQQVFGQLQYLLHISKKISYQLNTKYSYSYQRYLDPNYHNLEGKLDNRYEQDEIYLSNSLIYKCLSFISLSFSQDVSYGAMRANLPQFVYPSRWNLLTALNVKAEWKKIIITTGILNAYLNNKTKIEKSAQNSTRFSPFFSIDYQPLKNKKLNFVFFYKNIFRFPTFNDLYYQLVGNIHLKPENTHQFNLAVKYQSIFWKNKASFYASAEGYYNRVSDKIVALPIHNLFAWSMLNFGKVEIAGFTLDLKTILRFTPDYQLEILGNFTYQYSVDITDKHSKTYRHQIPYTPLTSENLILTFKNNWVNLSYSILFVGKRYSLPQNTPANELSHYMEHSLAFHRDFKLRKLILSAKFEVLNLFNKQYDVIRNYPMQGRSFRLEVGIKSH